MYAANTQTPGSRRILVAERLAAVPVPIYGGALALLGLDLLISTAWSGVQAVLWSSILRWMGGAALLTAFATHIAKAALAADAFRKDLCNPAVAPFFGQIGIALALLCESLGGSNPSCAVLAFQGSAAMALLALAHAIWLIKKHRPSWRESSPAWMLPAIQWLYLGVLAHRYAPVFRKEALTLGWVLAVLAGVCLALRAWRGPFWPRQARPALAIFLALPSIMLLAVLEEPQPSSLLTVTLYMVTLATCSIALAFIPRILGESFQISWWAYGMPLSAAAISSRAFAGYHDSPLWLSLIAQAVGILSIAITSGLASMSIVVIWRFIFLPSHARD